MDFRKRLQVAALVAIVTAVQVVAQGHGGEGGHGGGGQSATGGGHGTTTPAKPKIDKKARNRHRDRCIFIVWWIITGVVFAYAAVYFFHLLHAAYQRRKVAKARESGRAVVPAIPHPGVRNLHRATTSTLRNLAFVRVLPIPLSIYSKFNLNEVFWSTAYLGIVLGMGFYMSKFGGTFDYRNPMGIIATSQLPFVIGLAGRNNILSALTGVSYEVFNFLHRASARTCLLASALHVFKWIDKGLGKHGPGTWRFTTGVIAGVGFVMLWLTSFKIVRDWAYEFFLISHIAFNLMFLAGLYRHTPEYREYVWVGLFLWGLDRFCGLARLFILNKWWSLPFKRSRNEPEHTAKIEMVDTDVLRITLHRPMLRWYAGNHAYLTMPEIATLRYEQHPFTIANTPDESGNVVFLVRAQQGFTRRILEHLDDQKDNTFRTYIEGPYGAPHDMNYFDSVLLLAGGTGITHSLSHLLNVIKHGREGKTGVAHARLVWNVRHHSNAAWIAPLINEAMKAGAGPVDIQIDIHVTRSAAADEPGEPPRADVDTSPTASDEDCDHGSGEGSSTGSSEQGEKTRVPSIHGDVTPNKYALLAGFCPAAAAVTTFHHGRSHVERVLTEVVGSSPNDGGGIGVSVCGPTALALDVRRAVCNVRTARNVLNGQTPITFHSGNFGW